MIKIGDIELERRFGFVIVNGEYYDEISRNGKPTFIKIDKNIIKNYSRKADEIVKKLYKHLDRKKILKEAVMLSNKEEIDTLHKLLFKSKKKYKPKTRDDHCVDMKIGNFILPIID